MSIYDINYNLQADNLNVPTRRLPKFTAIMVFLLKPLQWLRDLFFIEYINGAYGLYAMFNISTTYSIGQRVIYSDRAVYEAISVTVGAYPNDITKWIKVCNSFVGLNERMLYTSQIITFEYLMNRGFFNTGASTQIYVQNNVLSQPLFVMGQTGSYSSAMASNSVYSTTFMCGVPSFPLQYNFTIYVPLALFLSLGLNNTDRTNAIRAYANNFVIAGISYNVASF